MDAVKNWFVKLGRFFRESWAEMKKVSWPNRRELGVYTVVTLFSVVVVAAVVWVIDVASSNAFRFLIDNLGK
jgi:preprotein translocase subunit SecE